VSLDTALMTDLISTLIQAYWPILAISIAIGAVSMIVRRFAKF